MKNQQNNLVEVDESFEGSYPEFPVTTEQVSLANEDFGEISLVDEENEYQKYQTERKIAPVVKEAVSEAVKFQNDKFKVEVNEVLQSEVAYRLTKYEKRRRRRDIKDKIGVVIKWIVVIGVIAFIYGTPQLRTKISILFRDFGDLVVGLVNNEEVTSNKLVEDALSGLNEDLNTEVISEEVESD